MVSCTRTKDRGRYLPEWVAYHWALGVDVMDIFDDDSVDDTREVSPACDGQAGTILPYYHISTE